MFCILSKNLLNEYTNSPVSLLLTIGSLIVKSPEPSLSDSDTFLAATKVLLKLYINNIIDIENISSPAYINKFAMDNTSLKAASV